MQPPPIHPANSGPRFSDHFRHAAPPGSQIEARIQNLPGPELPPNPAPPIQPDRRAQEPKPESVKPEKTESDREKELSDGESEWFVMSLCAIVVLAAEIASAPTLIHLAELCGFRYIELWFDHGHERARFWLSWMFPIVLDLYANVSAIVWFRSYPRYSKGTVVAAMVNTILATVLSVLCNGMLHLVTTQHWKMADATWLVVVVSAIPAAVLGASVHLIAMVVQDQATLRIRMHEVQIQIQKAMAAESAEPESAQVVKEPGKEIQEPDVNPESDSAGANKPESKTNRRRRSKPNTTERAAAPSPNSQGESEFDSSGRREATDAELEPIIAKFVDKFIAEKGKRPGREKVRDEVIKRGFKVGPERAGILRDKVRPEIDKENQ